MFNMKLFDFKTTNKILEEASKKSAQAPERTIYVFAGPNGSGKSTLIANLYLEGKLKVEYINADVYCNTFFKDVQDEELRNKAAMFFTTNKVKQYISEGKSFCYETVLSHPSKIELLQEAKKHGYKIVSTFVYTTNPEINVERVASRAKQGGHDVPKEKIVSRYSRALELGKKLSEISDCFSKFDNSKNQSVQFEK